MLSSECHFPDTDKFSLVPCLDIPDDCGAIFWYRLSSAYGLLPPGCILNKKKKKTLKLKLKFSIARRKFNILDQSATWFGVIWEKDLASKDKYQSSTNGGLNPAWCICLYGTLAVITDNSLYSSVKGVRYWSSESEMTCCYNLYHVFSTLRVVTNMQKR